MDPLVSPPDDVRVLHVDDDPAFANVVSAFLEREDEDLRMTTETDPLAALDRVGEERIDCIVSDYDMPGLNGLAFLREVRDRDEEVPFVLFTGKGSEEVAAEAIDAGVDAYLRKGGGPSKYAVLANRVRSLVDQFWAERRAERTERTYELVARTATDAFWIRDMATGETHYSEGISQFGYEPGIREDGFEWWVERVHPEDRDGARDLNARQREGAPEGFDKVEGEYGRFTYRYRWRRADGEYVECLSRGIVRFENGDPVEMVGAMTTLDDE